LAAIRTGASLPIMKPSAGSVEPSEQVAHAAFCRPSESAAVDASKLRCHVRRLVGPDRLPLTAKAADISRVELIR
jgi:hypothetical protein